MFIRAIILVLFSLLQNIGSACDCDGPAFFLQQLKYDYICHIKILKQYPSSTPGGRNNGLTKFIILNSKNQDQINDTLLFFNSSPSLCGQSISHYSEGDELIIKANPGSVPINESNCHSNIITKTSLNRILNNQNEPVYCDFKYKIITAYCFDQNVLRVEGDRAKGMISYKYFSPSFKFYKSLSLISTKLAYKYAKFANLNMYEKQSIRLKELVKILKFKKRDHLSRL